MCPTIDTKKSLISQNIFNSRSYYTLYDPVLEIKNLNIKKREKILQNLENKKFIVNIGRLTRQKNQSFLIKGFNKILKLYPDMHLVILGEGELEKNSVDIKGVLDKGMQLFGQWKANNNAQPVQGIPESNVEVEVQSEPESKSDKFYQQMKDKYSQESLDGSLKIWSVWLKHPELKGEFMKIVKQKIKEDGEA